MGPWRRFCGRLMPSCWPAISQKLTSQFAYEGVEPVRQLILSGDYEEDEAMDLRLDLIVAATVMEVELPEKEQWRVDVEKGREEREKLTSLVASSGECVSTFNSVPQINSPIFLHDLRHDPKSRPPISPFEHLGSLGSRRAEQLGAGIIPTRPRSRRSLSQHAWIVTSPSISPSEWATQASYRSAKSASGRSKRSPRSSAANSAPRRPWSSSTPSLTRRESWRMANNWTTSILAPVASANRSPFSKTLAQCPTPCVPSPRRA